VGAVDLEYDQLGNRPCRIVFPGDADTLGEAETLAVFVLLYERHREIKRRRKRD